jgi:hypothetical protein
MFWWGNFIPDHPDSLPLLGGGIGPFNLQELVDTRENARTLRPDGAPDHVIAAQESKFWEVAVNANKPINNMQILGFPYLITPQEFGTAIILQVIDPIQGITLDITTSTFTRHERNIDGVDYYIYQHTGAMTNPGTIDIILQFPN